MRGREPQLVLHDRATDEGVEVVNPNGLLDRVESLRLQRIGQIVVLHRLFHARAEETGAELVPAIPRNQVDDGAADAPLRRAAAPGVDDDFLGAERIDQEPTRVPITVHHVVRHAVHQEFRVGPLRSVDRDPDRGFSIAAPDVLKVCWRDGRRHEGHEGERALGRGHGVKKCPGDGRLLRRLLDIHQRGLTRDRDRLFDAADLQLDVQRGGEVGPQLKTLLPEDRKAGQRERDAVHAGSQLDDLVRALSVGHRRPDFFNQRRTGRLHRDARQHRSRRILHETSYGGGASSLGPGDDGEQQTQHGADAYPRRPFHTFSLGALIPSP